MDWFFRIIFIDKSWFRYFSNLHKNQFCRKSSWEKGEGWWKMNSSREKVWQKWGRGEEEGVWKLNFRWRHLWTLPYLQKSTPKLFRFADSKHPPHPIYVHNFSAKNPAPPFSALNLTILYTFFLVGGYGLLHHVR